MNLVTHSLRELLPSPWSDLILIFTAIVCGAIPGTERERQAKPAGLRTLMLVCLGSAVFTMVSYAFTTTTGDSGRVAAQIVTGIGFLGAGSILHAKNSISGMTTAAAIWMMAAIGMTVGTGYPIAALGLAVLVRLVLAGIRVLEIRFLGGIQSAVYEVVFDPDHGKTRVRLDKIREEFHLEDQTIVYSDADNGACRARLTVSLPRRVLNDFLNLVVDLPAVQAIQHVP